MADFSLPKMEVKVIFEFASLAGKQGKLVCTITDRQIEGYEKFCIPSCIIRDHWITIKHIFQDCPIIEKKLTIPLSHPFSGKQIMEYISYCRTGVYDVEKCNHPSYAIFADFMGDELFLDDFGKCCQSQFWSDEEMIMHHNIFWDYVYLPYINETFYLNIPQERKVLERYLHKTEYEKIDRSDPSWILTVDFEGLIDSGEYLGDLWVTRTTMVQHVSRKKQFSHKKCLDRFLTFNPLIAKKVLEDDPCMFICDTKLAVKLRKRVMTMKYDDLLEITQKELEKKKPEIICWTEEEEQRFQEFQGCKLNKGQYNNLVECVESFNKIHTSVMERQYRLNEIRKTFGHPESWLGNESSFRNPYAGRLSRFEQAAEAKTNKKAENYQKQQSANQKKKNRQRKKDEANQCYQGNGKTQPKRPIC